MINVYPGVPIVKNALGQVLGRDEYVERTLQWIKPARAGYLEGVVESRLSPVQPAVPQLRQSTSGTTSAAGELLLRPAQEGDVNTRIELGFESVATGNLADVQRYVKAAAVNSV